MSTCPVCDGKGKILIPHVLPLQVEAEPVLRYDKYGNLILCEFEEKLCDCPSCNGTGEGMEE